MPLTPAPREGGPEHKYALRGALASNVLQLVATDHAVFNSTQKAKGWAKPLNLHRTLNPKLNPKL